MAGRAAILRQVECLLVRAVSFDREYRTGYIEERWVKIARLASIEQY